MLYLSRTLLAGALLLLTTALTAQRLDSFPASQAEFLASLETLMTANKQKSMADTYADFRDGFAGGLFAEPEQAAIKAVGNRMLEQRMAASPFFSEYLQTVVTVRKASATPESFAAWHAMVQQMLEQKSQLNNDNFLTFLRFSQTYYGEGYLHPVRGNTVRWRILGGEGRWEYSSGEPVLVFSNTVDLQAQQDQDSLFIRGTQGNLHPLQNTWKARGGRVDWSRAGLDTDVYAELNEYALDVKRSIYEAESARLYYPLYFAGKPVNGLFSDKLMASNVKGTDISYPRFSSREGYIDIPDIGEGIQLRGGFELHGSTIYATAQGDRKAEVEIMVLDDAKRPKLTGRAERFVVRREERVVGEGVETTIFFGKDSLYHPSVNMRLDIPERYVQMNRGKRGKDRNPFFHSRNAVNIDADYLDIDLNTDTMIIGRPTISFANKYDVAFESLHYFDPIQYRRFQNIGNSNPLAIIKATSEQQGTRFISAGMIATRINSSFSVENIKSLLYEMVDQGFINYNSENEQVEVKEKVFHYVNADQKKADFDRIRIVSTTDTTNAVVDIRTGAARINGVKSVELSNRQRVALLPHGDVVSLKGDRDIDADGRIYAGFGLFEGKEFHFQYQPFQVRMDSIRYFDLFVPTGKLDANNQPEALSIASRLEHLNGVLLIDAPNNKSGREDIDLFPSFQSKGTSYVYYDGKETQEGVYGRDSFHFAAAPFSFDHLDKFGPQDLKFKGQMLSGGIFPAFDETLQLQEDQSLGFTTQTPDAGMDSYGTRGNYQGSITLNNAGMTGKGQISYLAAKVQSDDIVFQPNRTMASADGFDLEEERKAGQETPQVRGEKVKIEWKPYVDSMYVRPEEAPFAMYQANDHTFAGTLILTPGGLKGDGNLTWSLADLQSEYVNFGANSAQADTANVSINSLADDERLALETQNVNATVDFDKQVGEFRANSEELNTTLPYNQYITSINKFKWDMKGNYVEFKAPDGESGIFTSIHPNQDSLTFTGQSAHYDLATSLLTVSGVPHLVAADAFIYPDSGTVEIAPNADMSTLNNARIVADTTNKYHVIKRAEVEVLGRRNYRASGFYEYNIGEREQEVELQDIVGQPIGKGKYSDKTTATRAQGEVSPEQEFYIDHKTRFQGTITLDASDPNLQFDGFAQLDITRQTEPAWFTVSSKADKNDLAIRYTEPKDFNGGPLRTGFYLSKVTRQSYVNVMSTPTFRLDRAVLPATGVFKYNKDTDEFIFGDSIKVLGTSLSGTRMVYNDAKGTAMGEGPLQLGSQLKYVKVQAAGRISTEVPMQIAAPAAPDSTADNGDMIMLLEDLPTETDSTATTAEEDLPPLAAAAPAPPTVAEAMMGLQMLIPDALLKIVANDFKSATFDAKPINYLGDIDFYRRAIPEIVPAGKERSDALEGLSLGFLDLPKKVNPFNFLFSNLKLKWDEQYQSFVSTDATSGLVSVDGEAINKMAEIRLEVRMPVSSTNDDRLYLYLKSPSELFYFFGFREGILSITSNNTVFMEELAKLKEKDLIVKMEDGEVFEIQSVELNTANTFKRRVEAVTK